MKTLCLFFFAALAFNAAAHDHLAQPPVAVNLAPSISFDDRGQLWRVTAQQGLVQVDVSRDLGKSFAPAHPLNPRAQKLAGAGAAQPKIAISAAGNIYVTWTEDSTTASYLWFARSINSGKSFEPAYIVHQDGAHKSRGFDAINVSPAGTITLAWVDRCDKIAAEAAHKPYVGAAINYVQSGNHGASFNAERKLAEVSCDCGRMAITNKPDGSVVAMWRHIFAEAERDHMLGEIPSALGQPPQLIRATYGHGQNAGNAHHTPAIASGGEGADWWGYHMAYFDGNDNKPGLYYSRMDGVAFASSPAKPFGNNKYQAGHPALLSAGDKVWLVWREIGAQPIAASISAANISAANKIETNNNVASHTIIGMFSDDGGRSWGAAKLLASSAATTDYPQLLRYQEQVYLAWNTAAEGLRLIQW